MNNRSIQVRLAQSISVEQKHHHECQQVESKELKQLHIPSAHSTIKLNEIYLLDIVKVLLEYDRQKGLRRKIRGDQKDIKNLRAFANKCEQKRSLKLDHEDIFELILLLENAQTVPNSASRAAINQVKTMLAKLNSAILHWETLLRMLNALRYLHLDNATNLSTLMQNLWGTQQVEVIHYLHLMNQLPTFDMLSKLCQNPIHFEQVFHTIHLLQLQQCGTPEFINACLTRPEINWSIERIIQILNLNTKLDITANLKIIFQKTNKDIENIYYFLHLIEFHRSEYLKVLTQDNVNVILSNPEQGYELARKVVKSDKNLPVTSESFHKLVCSDNEVEQKQETNCRIQ